jgi:Prokaryotic cytochrome b561
MSAKFSQPYQPLLLRIFHGLTGFSAMAAIATAFWTYNTYDGRWGTIPLPKFNEIEGIHGTFGLWTLLIFPFFVVYAFNQGQQRLIQPDSLNKLTQVGQPIWWYTLHRLVNTASILALTFALFSGKMMSEKWLPQGELNHFWYSAHLVAWLILVVAIAIHLSMSIKVGGIPLVLSMLNWRFRSKDSPALWLNHLISWRDPKARGASPLTLRLIRQWLSFPAPLKTLEILVLIIITSAWIISLIKELS